MSEVEIVEVKTADLIGPALDWAVAKAENQHVHIGLPEYGVGHRIFTVAGSGVAMVVAYRPSTDWKTGGPLIENQKLDILAPEGSTGKWSVVKVWCHGDIESTFPESETALLAICRAVVSIKIGDTVQIPKELMQ